MIGIELSSARGTGSGTKTTTDSQERRPEFCTSYFEYITQRLGPINISLSSLTMIALRISFRAWNCSPDLRRRDLSTRRVRARTEPSSVAIGYGELRSAVEKGYIGHCRAFCASHTPWKDCTERLHRAMQSLGRMRAGGVLVLRRDRPRVKAGQRRKGIFHLHRRKRTIRTIKRKRTRRVRGFNL